MKILTCKCGQRFRPPVVCPVYCLCGKTLTEADLEPEDYEPALRRPNCPFLGAVIGHIDCGCSEGSLHYCKIHGTTLSSPPSKPLTGRTLTKSDGTKERITAESKPMSCLHCQLNHLNVEEQLQ